MAVCELLIAAGADLEAINAVDATPLGVAAAGKPQLGLCQALLAVVANANTAGSATGRTALHFAATSGAGVTCALLLEAGAWDAGGTAVGQYRDAPLHLAARFGDVTSCRTLIAAGAPVDALDVEGTTPLHAAAAEADLHRACGRRRVAASRGERRAAPKRHVEAGSIGV